MAPRKQATAAPWVLLIEFSSWQDANAARELIREAIPLTEEVILRPKNQHPSDGNVATWRTTALIREAFGSREFDPEGIAQIFIANGYNMQGNAWLTVAKRHGLIETVRAGRPYMAGSYRFVQNTSSISDNLCKAC